MADVVLYDDNAAIHAALADQGTSYFPGGDGHPARTVLDIGSPRRIFQHACSQYLSRCHHPRYEPNPSMKQFLKHQSGTGGFTYFLEAVGKKDDMVLLDIDASSCARRAG